MARAAPDLGVPRCVVEAVAARRHERTPGGIDDTNAGSALAALSYRRRGAVGGYRHRSARTATGRQALYDRFVRLARERFSDVPETELVVRAEQLRKAHYARLAFKSSVARSKAKTVKQGVR